MNKPFMTYKEENDELRNQLAASQLHAEQLREALEQITKQMFTSYKAKNGRDCYIEDDSGELCYIVPHEPIITAQAALSIPRDTSALDAYVAEKAKEATATQKEYYEGVFQDGSKQIATLTRQRDLAVEALEKIKAFVADTPVLTYQGMEEIADDAIYAIKGSEK